MEGNTVVNINPKSVISEQIRMIRTNIQFISADEEIKTILVTSSMSGEGKSFISSNLAIAFAQDNKKVLLVDSDMRKGTVNKTYGISNTKGLSNLLAYKNNGHKDNIKDYIVSTKISNLSLIPRGKVPPNPSELLNSEKTKRVIEELKKHYDIIIFDGAPINNGLADSLILSNYVDRVIIVAQHSLTVSSMLVNTYKMLENAGAKISGVVLNKIPVGKNKLSYYKYYGNRYYGNSYYGESSK